MGLADPVQVRRLALWVADGADYTRADAARVAAAAGVGWESTAAERFKRRVEHGAGLLRAAAAQLDQLSTALSEHAAAIEYRQYQIAAAKWWLEQHFDPSWVAAEGASDLVAEVENVRQAAASLGPDATGWLDLAGRLGWSW
ncbi:hypothetical protein [Frankia sp. CiP3]|uniref:hypothetical protein n=1 Tax=Frankia sp. CiP3 TaxID=2880971 RepID=UPI00272E796C|nr:hypothetical protein [Frankia sp. CiP3]